MTDTIYVKLDNKLAVDVQTGIVAPEKVDDPTVRGLVRLFKGKDWSADLVPADGYRSGRPKDGASISTSILALRVAGAETLVRQVARIPGIKGAATKFDQALAL